MSGDSRSHNHSGSGSRSSETGRDDANDEVDGRHRGTGDRSEENKERKLKSRLSRVLSWL